MADPPLRALVFDWDGTLHDSAEASYRSYVRLFLSFGIPFDRARFEETYAPDWHATYRALGLREDQWPEADRRWAVEYGREEHHLVPGTYEALERVKRAGLRQGLVTSGSRKRVVSELDAFGVADSFSCVVCSEDVRFKKPHPEGLVIALRALEVSPEEAAYIGDSPEDVAMAQAAGVRSVGVPGGFPNREALARSRPSLLASSLAEAISALV